MYADSVASGRKSRFLQRGPGCTRGRPKAPGTDEGAVAAVLAPKGITPKDYARPLYGRHARIRQSLCIILGCIKIPQGTEFRIDGDHLDRLHPSSPNRIEQEYGPQFVLLQQRLDFRQYV